MGKSYFKVLFSLRGFLMDHEVSNLGEFSDPNPKDMPRLMIIPLQKLDIDYTDNWLVGIRPVHRVMWILGKAPGGWGFVSVFLARLAKIKTPPLGLFTSFRPLILFLLHN